MIIELSLTFAIIALVVINTILTYLISWGYREAPNNVIGLVFLGDLFRWVVLIGIIYNITA